MRNIVVVLNYNDHVTTTKFLNNTVKLSSVDKIIVIDNNSTDNSVEELSKLKNDKIVVLANEDNRGYAAGNNVGIQYAIEKYNPEFITVSNPDVIFEDKAMRAVISFFDESLEKVGIVACTMNSKADVNTSVAWKLPSYWDNVWSNLILFKKIFGDSLEYETSHFVGESSEVSVVPGSMFTIRSSVIKHVGFFDEDTFLYCEENILSFKLSEYGYKNYILNNYEYIHYHSTTIKKNISSVGKRLDILFKSNEVYNIKYLKTGLFKNLIFRASYLIGKYSYLHTLYFLRIKR